MQNLTTITTMTTLTNILRRKLIRSPESTAALNAFDRPLNVAAVFSQAEQTAIRQVIRPTGYHHTQSSPPAQGRASHQSENLQVGTGDSDANRRRQSGRSPIWYLLASA